MRGSYEFWMIFNFFKILWFPFSSASDGHNDKEKLHLFQKCGFLVHICSAWESIISTNGTSSGPQGAKYFSNIPFFHNISHLSTLGFHIGLDFYVFSKNLVSSCKILWNCEKKLAQIAIPRPLGPKIYIKYTIFWQISPFRDPGPPTELGCACFFPKIWILHKKFCGLVERNWHKLQILGT